jgi:hypothetical protein
MKVLPWIAEQFPKQAREIQELATIRNDYKEQLEGLLFKSYGSRLSDRQLMIKILGLKYRLEESEKKLFKARDNLKELVKEHEA